MASMKRIQIYLDEKQLAKLKANKKKSGAPISEIIRRCIDKYLNNNKATNSSPIKV